MVFGIGYWTFFLNYQRWHEVYVKNCSLVPQEDLWEYTNVPLGTLYLTIGLIFELTYIPFLVVMLKKEFIQHSCYKFMFLIGLIDIFIVPCNSIITGIQAILGAHYCTAPRFFFFVGNMASTGYYGVTIGMVILALDRFLELGFPKFAKMIFGGNRIYFWLILPICNMVSSGFHVQHIYSTKLAAYYPDPFITIDGVGDNVIFKDMDYFVVNNIFCIVSLSLLYAGMLIMLKIKAKYFKVKTTKIEKILILQAVCITLEFYLAPLLYTFMLFIRFPQWVENFAQVGWIFVHGDTPIVYLILNKSLRRAVGNLVFSKTRNAMGETKTNQRMTRTTNQIAPSDAPLPVYPIGMDSVRLDNRH